MAYYRLYYFDGPDGRIGSVAEFEVHSDDCAIMTVEAGRRSAPMELWCGGRMVEAWPSLRRAANVQHPTPARNLPRAS